MRPWRRWALLIGGLTCATSAAVVEATGYRPVVLVLWLAGMALPTVYLRMTDRRDRNHVSDNSFNRSDVLTSIALLLAFLPLYLPFVYWIPFQMNADEVVISEISKAISGEVPDDLLGPSRVYFGIPSLVFAAFGKIAQVMGGAELQNMRLIHAVCGLLIIPPAYFFFRLTHRRPIAVVAVTVMMICHSLLIISRSVSRNNLAALNTVAALFFLLRGARRGSRFDLFVGGVVAGLSFYHYPPTRIIYAVWLVYLGVAHVLRRLGRLELGWVAPIRRVVLIGSLGFAMTIAPMVAATLRAPSSTYSREQLLIFPEGRDSQRNWYGKDSFREALIHNVRQGLVMFNKAIPDQAAMYWNVRAGFLDPISGWLLWVGLITAAVAISRNAPHADGHLLAIVGFITLFMAYLFVMNKAPNYTRLFVVLPLIALLVATSFGALVSATLRIKALASRWASSHLEVAVLGLSLAPIVYWNLYIAGDFAIRGFVEGDDIGSTARYVESKRSEPRSFFIASSPQSPYFVWEWGLQNNRDRVKFSAGTHQHVEALLPPDIPAKLGPPPWTLLIRKELWRMSEARVRERCPGVEMRTLMRDGSRLAVECQ